MRTRIPLAVVALLAVSACGSTVQQSSTTTLNGTSGDGLSSASGSSTGDAGTLGTGAAAGAGGSSTGLGTSGSAGVGTDGSTGLGNTGGSSGDPTGGGSDGTGAPPLPSQGSTGLGVTAKTISIGIGYSTDGDAANAAIGAGSFTQGDEKGSAQALIDEINAHGGVAGRKLVGVFHGYNVTSATPGSTQDQAACDDWTVDHKVIAVMSSSLTDTLVACLKQRGVLLIKAGQIVDADQTYLRSYSNELLLATMSQDRIFKDQAQAFQRQKYFTGWNTVNGTPGATTKVGVLTYDNDSFTRSLRHVILPALKAAGHAPAESDVIQVHKVQQQSDTAGTTAQIKSAVLRLQSDGVTHVVLGDASAFIMEFFAANARTQGYFPRLGVTSGAAPEAVFEAGLATAQQLNGISGNGWLPTLDLPGAEANKHTNSAAKRCLEILKRRTGQQPANANEATIALGDCDSLFIFQKAMSLAPTLSPAGLLAGFDKLAGSYVSPTVGPTFVSSNQHDTAVQAWDLNWVSSCTCVRYSSQRRVPSL
ncbi:MAG: hypothetical protein JWO22_1603 [Frankiales bacterium]|nr:hypothetical protein [Frankiales bacterium]